MRSSSTILEGSFAGQARFWARRRRLASICIAARCEILPPALRPGDLMVTAAGNLTHEGLPRWSAPTSRTSQGPRATARWRSGHARRAHLLRNKKELEQVHLCLGLALLSPAARATLRLLCAEYRAWRRNEPRLFQNIRERQVWHTPYFPSSNPYRDTGCLSIYAGTSLESAARVSLRSIPREFRELKQDPVPAEELRRAKDHLKGYVEPGSPLRAGCPTWRARRCIFSDFLYPG